MSMKGTETTTRINEMNNDVSGQEMEMYLVKGKKLKEGQRPDSGGIRNKDGSLASLYKDPQRYVPPKKLPEEKPRQSGMRRVISPVQSYNNSYRDYREMKREEDIRDARTDLMVTALVGFVKIVGRQLSPVIEDKMGHLIDDLFYQPESIKKPEKPEKKHQNEKDDEHHESDDRDDGKIIKFSENRHAG